MFENDHLQPHNFHIFDYILFLLPTPQHNYNLARKYPETLNQYVRKQGPLSPRLDSQHYHTAAVILHREFCPEPPSELITG
jgi:hypothetical protein